MKSLSIFSFGCSSNKTFVFTSYQPVFVPDVYHNFIISFSFHFSSVYFQGWDDVGFHGSPQIPTPNIDSLAKSGVILNSYYVAPSSYATKSEFMTGKYASKLGKRSFETGVDFVSELTLDFTTTG